MSSIVNNDRIREQLRNKLLRFYQDVPKEEIKFSFCPYNVIPVGAHLDHQMGKISTFSIDCGVNIIYFPSGNDYFEVINLNCNDSMIESVLNVTVNENKRNWSDTLCGVAKVLHEKYGITKGINALIYSSLYNEVTSETSIIIAFMKALLEVNKLKITKEEALEVIHEVEDKYIGASIPRYDQEALFLAKKNQLLMLDVGRCEHELIEPNYMMPSYKVALFTCGKKKAIRGKIYTTRLEELKKAGFLLKKNADTPYDMDEEIYLRDIPRDTFRKYGSSLPNNLNKRCQHFYSEMERVGRSQNYWERGEIDKFGKLMFESGNSSISNYKLNNPELSVLHEIMKRVDGIYGGVPLDFAFNGCALGIIDADSLDYVNMEVKRLFLEKYPQYSGSFGIYYVDLHDGVSFDENTKKKDSQKVKSLF